jgi:pimeloyl-ACP methyl ester carboxylesterase
MIQAFQLRQILQSINARHANEPISVAGHSAGGVVARLALVRGETANIKTLITIASPHLGTGRAEQALDVTDIPFPLSLFTDFFGGATYDTAMRSRSLFVDLVRQRPGTLLFWLNNLPHPDIEYFSVVRGQPAVISGDYVVPGYSQDMNNVPALQGRSSLIRVNNSNHGLTVLDGNVIVSVLDDKI